MTQDLHAFLNALEREAPGEILHIREPVSTDYTITAYVQVLASLNRTPLLYFHNVIGYDLPVITNLFGTKRRIALALGIQPDDFDNAWLQRIEHLTPPVIVPGGPAKDIVSLGQDVHLDSLPLLRHFQEDAGRYITSGVIVAKDPDTGRRNLSFHRLQFVGPRRLRTSLHSRGHLWDFYRRSAAAGRDLPAAIVVGAHPAVLLAAAVRASATTDEYDIAGALSQQPIELVKAETVDVEVPATSEIVLEGKILAGVEEPEGPFGEYTGYVSGRSTNNVFEVDCITRRKDAIFQDITPGRSAEHIILSGVSRAPAMLAETKRNFPNVRSLRYPLWGCHFVCLVSMKKEKEGEPQQVMLFLLGLDHYIKVVAAFDEDIDIYDDQEVLWALTTRTRVDRDVKILSNLLTNALEPTAENLLTGKALIDATMPLDSDLKVCTIPDEVRRSVRRHLGCE